MSKSVCLIIGAKKPDDVMQQIAQLSADSYVIYEGDEQAYSRMQQRLGNSSAAQQEKVIIEQQFVSADGKPATYYQFNDSEFNALEKPTGLFELFPSLKIISEAEVRTIAISDLIKLEQHSPLFLVLNEMAQAHALVTAMEENGEIARFHKICVLSSASELYKGSQTALELRSKLESSNFRLEDHALRSDDPEFMKHVYVEDKICRELHQAKSEFAVLKQTHDTTEEKLAELKQKHEATEQELVELKESLKVVKSQHSLELEQKESEKEKLALQNVSLISENSTLQKRNDLLCKELDKVEIQMELLKELIK